MSVNELKAVYTAMTDDVKWDKAVGFVQRDIAFMSQQITPELLKADGWSETYAPFFRHPRYYGVVVELFDGKPAEVKLWGGRVPATRTMYDLRELMRLTDLETIGEA